MLLQFVDHREALQVVLETAVLAHALVQRVLPGMAEGRMAEVVRQRDRLHQVLVQAQVARHRARDLRDLEVVRQARAKQVALVVHEHLGLVFEAAEGRRMDDAVAVALEFGARGGRRLGMAAAARVRGMGGVGGEVRFERGDGGRRDGTGRATGAALAGSVGGVWQLAGCFAHCLLHCGGAGRSGTRYMAGSRWKPHRPWQGAGAGSRRDATDVSRWRPRAWPRRSRRAPR